jgi:hypothetical protein
MTRRDAETMATYFVIFVAGMIFTDTIKWLAGLFS